MPIAIPTPPELATDPERPLPAAMLVDIACGLASASPLWYAAAHHDPELRRPVRLLATDRYEAWVIGWTTDQHARLHDHGASAGALIVATGELTEVVPRGDELTDVTLSTGRVRSFPAGIIHDVVNRAEHPATSIHVYSPPLTTMTYYDPVTLQPTETVAVAPEEPVLPADTASWFLHPSARP